ncbi:MAG TPA: ATP-binding protein [Tepidisphaeraceae bacterium]|nr:ATP-binding protein [Tepidisphaeraceae bacterium]
MSRFGTSLRPPWVRGPWRFGAALVLVGVAVALQLALRAVLGGGTPFLLFFPAVVAAALLGGFLAGVLATLASAVAAAYFFVEPIDSFRITAVPELLKLLLFTLEGLGISLVADATVRAGRKGRKFERAALESEAQLRLVTDALPALVSYVTGDYRYQLANRTYGEWFGLEPDRVIGQHMRDVVGERTFELVKPYIDRALAGERARFDGPVPYALGPRHIEATYVPDIGPDGAVRGVIVLVTDVTARKREELSARFLADAGSMLAGSLDYDVTLGRIARLAVPAIGDWCAIDMLGGAGDGNAAGAPGRAGLPGAEGAPGRADAAGAKPRRLAVAHSDPQKEQLAWELWRKFPPQPGAPGLMTVLASGKPELYENIPDELLRQTITDPDHLRIMRELGLRSAMIVPLVARGRTLGAITLVTAESGRTYGQAELQLAEELARRAALAVDNARLYADAQEANRAKDQFLATVSHELRTPLNAILGWAQLLATESLGAEEARHGVQTIERNAVAQAQLIEDLLDISRIVTGKLRLDVRPIELCPVIEAAIDSVRHAADAKGVAFARALDCGPVPVNGDSARLQQVVWNLLSNAIKFTPDGGLVQLRLERREAFAVLTVADNGPGVQPEFLPHVFDRFRQADSSSTRRHGGLGLGLSIVRHLVDLHGGTIDARNASDGTGAIFTVRLPLAVPHVAGNSMGGGGGGGGGGRGHSDSRPPTLTSAATIPAAPIGSHPHRVDGAADGDGGGDLAALDGVRVLVVDDEPDALDLVARVLRRSRAEVTVACSAADALAAIRASRPDVLLSDIAMPGQDGYDLIRQVREMERARADGNGSGAGGAAGAAPPLPAAALTAFARGEDRRRALSAGFQRHVAKPVAPAELTAVVAALAGREPQQNV